MAVLKHNNIPVQRCCISRFCVNMAVECIFLSAVCGCSCVSFIFSSFQKMDFQQISNDTQHDQMHSHPLSPSTVFVTDTPDSHVTTFQQQSISFQLQYSTAVIVYVCTVIRYVLLWFRYESRAIQSSNRARQHDSVT